jgi:hypothetical protein
MWQERRGSITLSAMVGAGALTLGVALSGMVGLSSDLHAETVRQQAPLGPTWNDAGSGKADTYVHETLTHRRLLHRRLVHDASGTHWVFCTPEAAAHARALRHAHAETATAQSESGV